MRYLPLFFFMLLAISAKGSHIIGGDIYYDDLGGGNYRFFITIYRDCNSSGAEYDNPLKLSVYKVNQDLYQNVNVSFPGSVLLPVNFDNIIDVAILVIGDVIHNPPTIPVTLAAV